MDKPKNACLVWKGKVVADHMDDNAEGRSEDEAIAGHKNAEPLMIKVFMAMKKMDPSSNGFLRGS